MMTISGLHALGWNAFHYKCPVCANETNARASERTKHGNLPFRASSRIGAHIEAIMEWCYPGTALDGTKCFLLYVTRHTQHTTQHTSHVHGLRRCPSAMKPSIEARDTTRDWTLYASDVAPMSARSLFGKRYLCKAAKTKWTIHAELYARKRSRCALAPELSLSLRCSGHTYFVSGHNYSRIRIVLLDTCLLLTSSSRRWNGSWFGLNETRWQIHTHTHMCIFGTSRTSVCLSVRDYLFAIFHTSSHGDARTTTTTTTTDEPTSERC